MFLYVLINDAKSKTVNSSVDTDALKWQSKNLYNFTHNRFASF